MSMIDIYQANTVGANLGGGALLGLIAAALYMGVAIYLSSETIVNRDRAGRWSPSEPAPALVETGDEMCGLSGRPTYLTERQLEIGLEELACILNQRAGPVKSDSECRTPTSQ